MNSVCKCFTSVDKFSLKNKVNKNLFYTSAKGDGGYDYFEGEIATFEETWVHK